MVAIVRLSMDEKIFDEEAKATANDKKGKAKKPLQFINIHITHVVSFEWTFPT